MVRGAGTPTLRIMFGEGAREGQMTSAFISPSTFFFCFSITASSSDPFSLSYGEGGL